jgi:hypothetical protein
MADYSMSRVGGFRPAMRDSTHQRRLISFTRFVFVLEVPPVGV